MKGNVLFCGILHNICDALLQGGNCLSKNINGIKGNLFEWAAENDCMSLITTMLFLNYRLNKTVYYIYN